MDCGAAFIFDEQTEAGLREAWKIVAEATGSAFMLGLDYPPHMTILMAEEMDPVSVRAAWAPLLASTAPLHLDLPALGVFTGTEGVVFLAPTVNRALLDLQAALWQAAETGTRHPASYYGPGEWVPHITVGFNLPPELQAAAVDALSRQKLLHKAVIVGVMFGSFRLECGSKLERMDFTGK